MNWTWADGYITLVIWITGVLYISTTGAATAQNVIIEGTVRLEAATQPPSGTNIGGYQTRAASGNQQNDTSSNNILIWIEARNPQPGFEAPATDSIQVLDQENKRFQPRLMGVRAGGYVRIINSDPVYHNVFSLSSTRRFDVGRRSPEEYQDVRFPNPGVVDVFCDIHSNMHAVIRVLPQNTLAWQKLESSGSFQFANIPSGSYTIHFQALGNRSAKVQVQAPNSDSKITLQPIRIGAR